MVHGVRWIGLLLIGLAALPAWADDKPAAKKPDAKKEAKEKLIATGQLFGRLTEVDGSARTLTLEVTLQIPVPNEEAVARHAELAQELLEALTIPDPGERLDRVREVRAAMVENAANLYTIEEQQQSIPLQGVDELQVRVLKLPPVYDDKGRPRRYTTKELRELKGSGNAPGYRADLDDLREGQVVRVTLARKKAVPKKGEAQEQQLLVTMVVILAEPE
jgi:hypothetical protein